MSGGGGGCGCGWVGVVWLQKGKCGYAFSPKSRNPGWEPLASPRSRSPSTVVAMKTNLEQELAWLQQNKQAAHMFGFKRETLVEPPT